MVGGGDGGVVLEAPRPGVCGEGLCSASAGDRILQAAHTYAATLNTETMLSKCMRPNTAAILNVLYYNQEQVHSPEYCFNNHPF